MDIVQLDADDLALVTGAVAVENAAHAVDAPWVHPSTVRGLQGRIRYGWDLEPGEHYVGVDDGRVVSIGAVFTSEWDNKDLAWLDLVVDPQWRRHGRGSQMDRHLVDLAVAKGRSKLGTDGWDGAPGEQFAKHHGLKRASQAINRRQHLDELSPTIVEKLYAEAADAAAAYELVRVFGRTPEALRPAVAEMTAAINDAPLDDLEIDDEVFPPERVDNYETATLVRGHRLGLLLKSAMNLWLAEAEPKLRTVDTWNAESNDHMIAVNEALSYRAMGRELQYQR